MRTICFALLCALALPAAPAWSQASEEVARRLISEGVEAARSRDWPTARDRFQRAYDIQPLPLTLYNLGAAQEKTGLLVEAERAYRIFLKETVAGELDRFRQAAIDARVKLRTRIAYLVLKSPNLAPGDAIHIDDRELARAVLGEALPSNPGVFAVTVRRGGRVILTRSVTLAEGESKVEVLDVPAPVPGSVAADSTGSGATAARSGEAADRSGDSALTAASPPPPEDDDDGILSSPVLWLVVTGVVLAGAGVGTYFAVRPESAFDSSLEAITIRGR